MSLSISDRRVADAIVSAVEERVLKRLGSYAFLDVRFGTVVAAPVSGYVSVYIGGDTYASPNFKVPTGMTLTAGNKVRVAIDPRGDRWVADKY